MSAITPYIVGPLPAGTSFMMGTYLSIQLFILTAVKKDKRLIYQLELADDILTMDIEGVGIFTASGTTDNITIKDSANGGGLAMDGNELVNSFTPQSFKMIQSAYQPWNPPDLLLSRVIYSLYTSDGKQIVIPTFEEGSILADSIFAIPVTWHFNQGSPGSNCLVVKEASVAIEEWECTAAPNNKSCNSFAPVKFGWTNFPDCEDGIAYQYCSSGTNCGDTSCKGPCTNKKVCDYDSGDKLYNCGNDPSDWWKSGWFIGTIVGVGAFILIMIITIAVYHSRQNKKERLEEKRMEFFSSPHNPDPGMIPQGGLYGPEGPTSFPSPMSPLQGTAPRYGPNVVYPSTFPSVRPPIQSPYIPTVRSFGQ